MTHPITSCLRRACIGAAVLGGLLVAGCAGPKPSTGAATPANPTPAATAANPADPAAALRMSPQLGTAPRPKPKLVSREPANMPETPSSALPDTSNALFFGAGSAAISPEGKRMLQALAERLKENRRATITLIGHSDDTGSTEFDVAMAQRRVDAAATELQKAGLASRQIRRVSYGNESGASAPCSSEPCRQRERRVDLVVDG